MSSMKLMKWGTVLSMWLSLAGSAPLAAQENEEPRHLPASEREAIDSALQRGLDWLRALQGEDGAWRTSRRTGICPVALTAMALWASAEVDVEEGEGARESEARAVSFLLEHRREDGGLYSEGRGLRVYTSGVAARALEAEHEHSESPSLLTAARDVGLYAYRGGIPESFVDDQSIVEAPGGDQRERARALLTDAAESTDGERRALEFLARHTPGSGIERPPQRMRDPRWKAPGPEDEALSYEDVLPLVYAELRPEQQLARRARTALQRFYTLEQNPDLTRRWTRSGFHQPEQGLYYYYLGVARVLLAFSNPKLSEVDGTTHDWPRELSKQLIKLQREDGSWVNENARWWEGEPILTTTYALLALRRCRDAPPEPGRKVR